MACITHICGCGEIWVDNRWRGICPKCGGREFQSVERDVVDIHDEEGDEE